MKDGGSGPNEYLCSACHKFFSLETSPTEENWSCAECQKEFDEAQEFRLTLKGFLSVKLGMEAGMKLYEEIQEFGYKRLTHFGPAMGEWPCIVLQGGGIFIGVNKERE